MQVGLDIQGVNEVSIAISRFGDRYRRRIFTEEEVLASGGWGGNPQRCAAALAMRFAAKEATHKVLRPFDVMPDWREIEVLAADDHSFGITLSGHAAALASQASLTSFVLSVSVMDNVAVALVVAT